MLKIGFILLLLHVIQVQGSPPNFPVTGINGVKNLLMYYAQCGITYSVISCILQTYHNIKLSSNAIRKRLKRYGLPSRRGPTLVTPTELESIILDKLKTLPKTVGYKQITCILKQEGYHVRRYDKLKPYGFPIHGCIDGYSRKLIWLQVGPSNNDPRQVAYHYMCSVEGVKGCPLIIQSDKGTENTIIGALQCVFREDCEGGISGRRGFQHISSQLNQRIEAWWAMFRRRASQWWIDFFKDLVKSGLYEVHKENSVKCMRYCFMPLIQRNLDDIAEQWNNHHICTSRHGNCPNGKPNVLYSLPLLTGARDCLQAVNESDITFGFSQTVKPTISGDDNFDRFAAEQFSQRELSDPDNWQQALQRYFILLQLTN